MKHIGDPSCHHHSITLKTPRQHNLPTHSPQSSPLPVNHVKHDTTFSTLMVDPSRSLSVNVISCSNIPWGNVTLKNCDPYVRVYLDGPIKTYLGRTPYHANIPDRVEWGKAGQLYFNPVRGLRLYFELFDNEVVANDQLLGTGTYDPNFDAPAANGEVSIPLVCVGKFKKPRPNEPTVLKVAVTYTPSPVAFRPDRAPPQQNPVYLTLVTKKPVIPKIPYSQTLPDAIRTICPLRLPFELSIALFQPGANEFTLVHSGNRSVAGAWHSGWHPCGTDGLSPTIRLDPALLGAAGFHQFVVALVTPNYAPLVNYAGELADLIVWSSREKPKEWSGEGNPIEIVDRQDLKAVGQLAVPLSGTSSAVVLAVGTIQKVKTTFQVGGVGLQVGGVGLPSSQFQVEFQVAGVGLPSSQFPQSPQTAGQFIPVVAQALQLAKVLENFDFPLLVPKTLPATLGQTPSIKATAKGYKSHYLTAQALDVKFATIWQCSQGLVNPADGVSYKGTEGAILVELSRVKPDVSFILFTIHGAKPFSDEGKIDATKNKFDVVGQQALTLFITKYKRSQRKNGLLWFALSRDGFGSWTLIYTRIGVSVTTQE
jgi:hypothetical protein